MKIRRNIATLVGAALTVQAGLIAIPATAQNQGSGRDQPVLAMHEMMQMNQPMQGQGAPMGGGSGMMNNMNRMPQGDNAMGGAPGGMQVPNGAMGGMGNMGGMGVMTPGNPNMLDRIEGRVAFLKAELQITDAQLPAWNQFAESLRASRRHLLEAQQQLTTPVTGMNPGLRLEQYEKHLAARLDAIKAARAAFGQLYGVLDEHQRHTADELVAPLIAAF